LRDLVISVLHPLRQSRTLHTLTFGPISGVHFKQPATMCKTSSFARIAVEQRAARILSQSEIEAMQLADGIQVIPISAHALLDLS
jgi:hypothetical protein